jgi:hypothetical protein
MMSSCDSPLDPPPPRAMADALMARAWDDDCPDLERVLLEQAANVIADLLVRLTASNEREEARVAIIQQEDQR